MIAARVPAILVLVLHALCTRLYVNAPWNDANDSTGGWLADQSAPVPNRSTGLYGLTAKPAEQVYVPPGEEAVALSQTDDAIKAEAGKGDPHHPPLALAKLTMTAELQRRQGVGSQENFEGVLTGKGPTPCPRW